MEKVTLVESFNLSDAEIKTLGAAANVLADVVEFVLAESAQGITVKIPESLANLVGIFEANLEDLAKVTEQK